MGALRFTLTSADRTPSLPSMIVASATEREAGTIRSSSASTASRRDITCWRVDRRRTELVFKPSNKELNHMVVSCACGLRENDDGPDGAQTGRRGDAGPVGGLL